MQRVNAHLAELLGFSPAELLGRSIFEPALTQDVDDDQAQFERQIKGEIDRYTINKRFRRADGTQLWVSVTSSSVRDLEGQFLYAVRVQRNITEQRTAEEALARRADQQAALFEFTAGMQRSGTLEEIYGLALDAIIQALRCDRASILLLDSSAVMKFVAARNLSEIYQRAVEGHSPWTPDAPNPEPICITDIDATDLPESLKTIVRTEGVQALAFIPIIQRGRLIGKFMTYYDRRHTL